MCPQGAFAESVTTGNLGRFEGFLYAYFQAAFVVMGPEYMAMVAGETANPRKTIKPAFKTVYLRFGIFFIGGALCCGIVVPYNDPKLVAILNGDESGAGTGAASPYVIAIQNMGISVLRHITNDLLITSIFSAGNTLV
jgi:amino acid transporter